MREMFPDAPDEADNEVCEDGTACHWLAAEIWEGRHPQEGSLSPNFRELTEDMFDAVDLYHDVLRSWQNVMPVVEQPVSMDVIYSGMKGTPDAWAYDPSTRTLYIADLKYGFRFVEVWHNWQLTCYAIGLLHMLGLVDDLTENNDIRVVMTIVQPRSYGREGPVRTSTRSGWTFIQDKLPVLQKAAADRVHPEFVVNPGCFDCPGRHICESYRAAEMWAIHRSYHGLGSELDEAQIASAMREVNHALKILKDTQSSLEAQAEAMIKAGKRIIGFTMYRKQGREGWEPGREQEIINLAKTFYSVDIRKPARAITPNQARKLLPSSIVNSYAQRNTSPPKLSAVDPLEAVKAFTKE